MFPVFTSPRGSRKATFLSESTEKDPKTSATELVVVVPEPLVSTTPLGDARAWPVEGAVFVRTRSAQDLGAGLAGDDTGAGTVSAFAFVSAGATWRPSAASVVFVSVLSAGLDFGVVDVTLVAALGCDVPTFGTTGLIGIIGTTGFVAVLIWDIEADGRVEGGGKVDEGVVGCVESTSEGACEVAGVSRSEAGAAVDVCETACSSATVCSCTCSSPSMVSACPRVGNSSPSSVDATGPRLRLRLFDDLGGNGASGTDNQGSGG